MFLFFTEDNSEIVKEQSRCLEEGLVAEEVLEEAALEDDSAEGDLASLKMKRKNSLNLRKS